MNTSHLRASALLALCALGAQAAAFAQAPAAPAPPEHAAPTAVAPDGAAAACCAVADGTIVELEIAEPLSSKTAQRGQRFKLRLTTALHAGGTLVLPAGTEGVGEVVHADRARAAGKPGELLLAGRALHGPHGEVALRGFRMGGSGENRTVAAFWIPLGFLMRGGQIEIPVGARAHAKLAGAHRLAPAPATAPPASGAAEAVPVPAPATTDAAPAATVSSDPTQAVAPADHGKDPPPTHPPHPPTP